MRNPRIAICQHQHAFECDTHGFVALATRRIIGLRATRIDIGQQPAHALGQRRFEIGDQVASHLLDEKYGFLSTLAGERVGLLQTLGERLLLRVGTQIGDALGADRVVWLKVAKHRRRVAIAGEGVDPEGGVNQRIRTRKRVTLRARKNGVLADLDRQPGDHFAQRTRGLHLRRHSGEARIALALDFLDQKPSVQTVNAALLDEARLGHFAQCPVAVNRVNAHLFTSGLMSNL